jgi:SAM-dependent methyltransferase
MLHLPDPESALVEWRRITRPGGVVSIYVPNEPGVLTRLGRAVTTRRAAQRAGFQGFDLMMAREHHNHGWGLDKLIRHTFRDDDLLVSSWPIPRAPFSSRVFSVYHARITA